MLYLDCLACPVKRWPALFLGATGSLDNRQAVLMLEHPAFSAIIFALQLLSLPRLLQGIIDGLRTPVASEMTNHMSNNVHID